MSAIEQRLDAIEQKLTALIELLTPGPETDPATGLPYGEVQASCFEIKDGKRTGQRIAWSEQVEGFDPARHAVLRDSLREPMTEQELSAYCKNRLAELVR